MRSEGRCPLERDFRCLSHCSDNSCLVLVELIYQCFFNPILGPVYDNKKENWRILTNKEIYASVKNLLK